MLQIIHSILVISVLVVLSTGQSIIFIYLLNALFTTVNSMMKSIQASIVPLALQFDEHLIHKSVDIQYFTGNTLDILSNLIASFLVVICGFFSVIYLSFPFFY